MPITSTSSTIPNQTRNTKPRNQKQQKSSKPISATDPMYSIVPAPRSKSTISSLLLTPFSPTSPTHDHPTTPITKKNKFTSFRGLGCRATSQVSVPSAIRTSADWEKKKKEEKKKEEKEKKEKKEKKEEKEEKKEEKEEKEEKQEKKQEKQKKEKEQEKKKKEKKKEEEEEEEEEEKEKKKKKNTLNFVGGDSSFSTHNTSCNNPSCMAAPDVWCGPGIGLTTDATSVYCVVSTRPLSARGRDHVDKITPRELSRTSTKSTGYLPPPTSNRYQVTPSIKASTDGKNHLVLWMEKLESPPTKLRRSSCSVRRMVSPEDYPFLDTETLEMPRSRADWFGFRYHRHSRYGFPEGLAEIVMLQNSLMGERTDGLDRHRSWRLNVDNMSYEELLELGDRIGYVSTGLKEDEITQCVRRTKPFFLNHLSHLRTELEKKCSICQEEYDAEDEMGKLGCGHFYHIHCIKQWLMHKNSCPICKSASMSDS